jgi:hypothetical protein
MMEGDAFVCLGIDRRMRLKQILTDGLILLRTGTDGGL